MNCSLNLIIALTIVLCLALPTHGQNWTQFRGPHGNGLASNDQVTIELNLGREIWRVDHGKGFSITPMPLYVDGTVIMSTGYGKPDVVAIDPRGKGDITKTNILWRESRSGSVMPSRISIGGLVYSISDGGIVSALRTGDGSLVWRQRLGGKFSASPFAVGRNVIVADHEGKVTIFRAGDSYEEIAKYEFGEQIMASPVPIGNDLLVRTKVALYRFGSNRESLCVSVVNTSCRTSPKPMDKPK